MASKPSTRYWAWHVKNGQDYFVLSRNYKQQLINFWHFKKEWRSYIAFLPDEEYHVADDWTVERYRALEAELMKPDSRINTLAFAVNEEFLISNEHIPFVPKAPRKFSLTRTQLRQREQRLCAIPAPYVLFAKFPGNSKEFAWWLYKSVIGWRDIKAGDPVIVLSQYRRCIVTVTRVEPFDGTVTPTARVLCIVKPQWLQGTADGPSQNETNLEQPGEAPAAPDTEADGSLNQSQNETNEEK